MSKENKKLENGWQKIKDKKIINSIIKGDAVEKMREIPDNTIDLIVADPPYWKVAKESWDYQWRTKEDYIEWSKEWFKETKRVLRVGGSFYLFGYFRMLSLLLPDLIDNGLELRQQIIINKGMQAVAGRATNNYKLFPNVTESILFLYKDNKPFIKDFLKFHQDKKGYTGKKINKKLGVKSNGGGMWSIYTGNNVCKQAPTEEKWNKLSKILDFNIPYNKISITFNRQEGYTNVWDDINFYNGERDHPTQKPLKVITRIIEASSDKNDVVLDPFLGSGTTAVACKKMNRKYIGIEINDKYCKIAKRRLKNT